jgi:hypothetical protein
MARDDGGAIQYRNRTCPACSVATVTLPWFTTRRRHPVTCTNCGAKLQRVLPGVPYYTLSFITALMLEASSIPLFLLGLFRQWGWMAVVVMVLLAVNLAVSAFLNSRTRVEFAEPEDARKDKPGRWYPT